MKMAKTLDQLIRSRGMTIKDFALANDIPPSTIYSVLKRGVANSSVTVTIKICKGLGITIAELVALSGDESLNNYNLFEPENNPKDIPELFKERPELVSIINSLKDVETESLLNLAKALQDASPEDIELISTILDKFKKGNKKTTSK